MKLPRRRFLHLAAGATMLPVVSHFAKAQQLKAIRHIGVLMSFAETDTDAQSWISALLRRLDELGWTDGQNAKITYRWSAPESRRESLASELLALHPDVIIAAGTPAASALFGTNRLVPVVMVQVADPVELGFVASLSRPGGNMTGFSNFELTIGGKWLQFLREIAPNISRVGIVVDPGNPSTAAYLHAIEVAAPAFKVDLIPSNVHTSKDIEIAFDDFGHSPNCGVIVLPAPATSLLHQAIVAAAAQRQMPAIYPYRLFADAGGLISYGADLWDMYRRAAAYVDRILKGERPADLPVQAPAKYELVINLKTAKALGFTVPVSMQAVADGVIE
jgi:putative tryptophan/tyrosine transport system substrate-binding protein